MNRQYAQMQFGERSVPEGRAQKGDFTVPFSRVPELGLELVKLAREVKIQEVLVTLLTQQLEQARIAEARNGAIAGVIMLVLGVSLAVMLENNASRRFGKR